MLKEISSPFVATLLQAEHAQARTAEFRSLGKRILAVGRGWERVDWRQFSHMHNASIIKDKSFEGGNTRTSIGAWLSIFSLWKKGEGCFFSFHHSPKLIEHVCLVLNDLKDFCYHFPPLKNEPMQESEVLSYAKRLQRAIKSRIKQRGTIYLPLGYRHGVSNEGHAMPVRLEQKSRSVIIHILNLGNGSSPHPILDYTTSQDKVSFRSFPLVSSNSFFWGESGLAALCHLVRYAADPPHPSQRHYHGEDLYDIFQTLGVLNPHLGSDPKRYEAKGQRSGTCAEKGVKNVVHDTLIDQGVSGKEIKKIFLNLYLCSLISGYHTYTNNRTASSRILLRNAAEEFGLALEKLKKEVEKEEYLGAYAVVQVIKEITLDPLQGKSASIQRIRTNQRLSSFPHTFPKIENSPPAQKSQRLSNKKGKSPSQSLPDLYRPQFDSKRIPALLDEWLDSIHALPRTKRFTFLYDCTLTLPIPEWGKKGIWDTLPPHKVSEIITMLEGLLCSGLKAANYRTFFLDQFLVIHTLYVIADKLARLNKKTSLDGFASPFAPFLFSFDPQNLTSIPLGVENHRYSQIVRYFRESQQAANNQVIFPVSPLLSVEQYEREATHSSGWSQGKNHILFLQQFVYDLYPDASNLILAPIYLRVWKNTQTMLPKEISSLYYFAYLSHTLFLGAQDSFPFPSQMRFVESEDQLGKRALRIESDNKEALIHHPDNSAEEKSDLYQVYFKEMEYGNQLFQSSAISIFTPYYRSLTTNDAVCERLSEYQATLFGISESVFRDLLRITRKENLKLPLALQWAVDNLVHLEHQGIQSVLERCFFSPEGLYERLKEEPSIVHSFREFIGKGLAYYRNNPYHLRTILFLIRTGVYFETHYAHLYGAKKCGAALLFYQEKLNHLLSLNLKPVEREEAELHLMLLQLQREDLNLQEILSLTTLFFSSSFRRQFNSFTFNWLNKRKPFFIRLHAYKLQPSLKDRDFRNRICEAILKHNLPDHTLNKGAWEGQFPSYSSGEYTINFLEATVSHHNKGALTALENEVEFQIEEFQHFKKTHGVQFWHKRDPLAKTNEWHSLDGRLHVKHSNGTFTCKREILFKGRKRWVRLHSFKVREIDALNLDFLNYHSLLPYCHYVFLDKEKGDPDIITYNGETDRPEFRIDYQGPKATFTRLDEDGNPLPIVMTNLSEVKSRHHLLYACSLRFSHPSHVFCFVNTKTQLIEEIHFFYLKLQFKRGKDGLESIQFPGFFLNVEETLEEVHHYPGMLVLENRFGKKKALLPAAKLKSSSHDFSTEIELTKHFYHTKNDFRFFVFDIDPVEGSLNNHEVAANLYLALVLKTMGTEEQILETALKYLYKAKGDAYFDSSDVNLLKGFARLKDRSPASLAFNVKLLYLTVDTMNLMLEARFKRKNNLSFHNLLRWGEETYLDYIKTLSNEELSAIPRGLRLTRQEESAILRTLKREIERQKRKLPTLMTLRYQLLCTGKETVTATIAKKPVTISPAAYSLLKPPGELRTLKLTVSTKLFPYGERRKKSAHKWENVSLLAYPNRMTVTALEAHFPELFEVAKSCGSTYPHPFDFKLLATLKTQSNRGKNQLGQLLFYVRHFSHHFKQLTFKGVNNERKKIAIFNEIVERVTALEETEEYRRFCSRFLFENTLFDYQKKTVLRIPPIHESDSPLVKREAAWNKTPFLTHREKLFTLTEHQRALPETPLFNDSSLVPKPESLEADLVEKFSQGYRELKKKPIHTYSLNYDQLNKVEGEIRRENKRRHTALVQKREELIRRVNIPYRVHQGKLTTRPRLFEETQFRLHRETLQTMPILPETIMKEVILRNNPSYLERHCPLLKRSEIQEIIDEVCGYYHMLVLYQLSTESLAQIAKLKANPKDFIASQELYAILDYSVSYDPREYPEIAYFKVTEGKLPRKEQADVYRWVCQQLTHGKKCLFQHKAGGGKTVYLTPLLMLRAKRMKKMPIFFTTQMIYAVDKQNLAFTLARLDENLSYLEIGLHSKLSEDNLKFIFEQLVQLHKQGRGMIMIPQTFYAFKLQHYYAGIKEENAQKVKWLGLILNFFETECLQIVDESHQSGDPITRAIYGIGEFNLLPEHENQLFLALLKPLLGIETVSCDGKQSISEVSRLGKNLVGAPSKKEIKRVQEALARHMCSSPLLNIPRNMREEFFNYWTDPKSSQPKLLKKWAKSDRKRADLIALTGYFILDLLPEIVKMRTELDHAPSIFPEEEFDTPCHHKTPSTAQYEIPYLASALTIKGTAHRSLSEWQIRSLLEMLIKREWKEQRSYQDSTTPSVQLFASWLRGSPLENMHLRDISLSNPKQIATLTKHLAKHPPVIEYYLTNVILKQIGYSLEQLTCTPAHFINGFAHSVLFSATPSMHLIYPRSVTEVRYDPLFETEVVAEYCKAKNQQKVFTESPDHFFSEMKKNASSPLKGINVFIDPQGFFCDFPNEEVARKWLETSSELDGVLYFKEGRSLKVDKDEKLCLLLRKKPTKPIELQGSNIKEALSLHHLNWKTLNLGTYYGASHTESANILQKKGTKAFVYVADNLTASRLIQALMRLRGLLTPQMAQNVIWVYPRNLAKKIPLGSDGMLNGAALFAWTIHNEVEQTKKRIILSAFQEIAFKIEQLATAEIKKALNNPEEQIALMKRYSKGLLELRTHDPYGTYAEHEREELAETVLMRYAHNLYDRFGYAISFNENISLQKEIQQIVQGVQKRIQTIATNWGRKLSTTVEQNTRLKKDTEQTHYRPRPFDPLSAEGIYGTLSIDNPVFPDHIPLKSGRDTFNTKGLTKNLYFAKNQLLTAKNAGKSLGKNYLKPIDFFIIIITEEETMAIAQSNEIISADLKTLVKGTDDPKVKHQVFLVSANGKLIQKGNGVLRPKEEEVKQILESEWMRDLVIDAALLKGQIRHKERLKERIAEWEAFPKFWKEIVEALPNPETAHHMGMARLIKGKERI